MENKKEEKNKFPKEVTLVAWILVVGAIAPMLDTTMVNIAINQLMQDFHTTLNTIQWAITGYVLALAIAIPISGWLLDHFNGKKIFSLFIGIFGLMSLLSGISWDITSFITFRAFQGFSAGVITMLLTALLVKVAGPKRLGALMAIVTTPIILGPIFGPVLGGFIVQYLNWHWIFFVNVPVVIISILLNIKYLPNFEPFNPDSKIDWWGILLLSAISTSIIYGIIKASNSSRFFNEEMLIFCGIGLILLVVYIIYNYFKKGQTILPLKLFKHRNFFAACIGLFLAGIAINGPMLLLPLLFQNIFGFTVIGAAFALIPQGLGMLVARPFIGKMVDKIGAKYVVLLGILVSFIGSVPLIWATGSTSMISLSIVLFIRGLGIGGITMPLMVDAYLGIHSNEIPQASVGSRMIQNIGSSFGSAVVSAVVSAVIASQVITKNLLLQGYQTGFLVSCIVIVVISVPSLFLTNKTISR
ncbi:MAG: multidrug efflux MFS transporter [Methanobrevibacter sp.]|nr:multidrug efflux MFS transporter [Methanobrevibacter sp.]